MGFTKRKLIYRNSLWSEDKVKSAKMMMVDRQEHVFYTEVEEYER